MNKLLIGLLIIAAGAGAFFLLRQKKANDSTTKINKEWILGQWKTDDLVTGDSSFHLFHYDFLKDGHIVRSLNDSSATDTTHYEWKKKNELRWSGNNVDTTIREFAVIKLTMDSLQVRTKDSAVILFTKLK